MTLALLGAVAAVRWQDQRPVVREATARVAFIEDVGFGNLDAERSYIVNDESAVSAGLSIDGVTNVQLIVPPSRSHIDVAVSAATSAAAESGADAVAATLITTSIELESADIDESIARVAGTLAELDGEISALEASMAEELQTEASANASLSGDLEASERERLTIAGREASDAYWTLTRERNSLLDLRNSNEREHRELTDARSTAGNLRVVEPVSVAPEPRFDSTMTAAVGGGLIGAGVALFAFWVFPQRRNSAA